MVTWLNWPNVFLAEVPDQLVDYMKLVGRKPRPAVMVDMEKIGFSTMPSNISPGTMNVDPHQPQGGQNYMHPNQDGANQYNAYPGQQAGLEGQNPYGGVQNPQIVQNTHLMNAGNVLVQQAMGMEAQNNAPYPGIPLEYVQPNQPTWMAQQGNLNMGSFPMTESVVHTPGGQQGHQNQPYSGSPNDVPRYQI